MKNKRFLSNILYGALLLSWGVGAVSCKDNGDEITELKNRITTVEESMTKFKKQIEDVLNANLTVQSYYSSADQTAHTVVLSNGEKLEVQASGAATPFYQFKIEEGTWRYTADKGALWSKVLTAGSEKEIAGTEKDQLFYDKSNGYIYILKGEETIQTALKVDPNVPLMAENKENKTLTIYIYGENYILPVQGGGFSGIGSILFQKRFVFDADEFLEAASYSNKKGDVVDARTATARFKILPKTIDLTGAEFACTDIHELIATRAAAPQLLVKALDGGKLDENGILTVELTPQNMTADYYGAVLEITLDKTTSSSNYFVVKPTSYSAADGVWALRGNRAIYTDSEALQFISSDGLDLNKVIGWGFGKTGEVKFAEELGFKLDIVKEYAISVGTNEFDVTTDGVLTAKSANKSGKIKVTYTVAGDVFEREFTVYAQDEATAKGAIGLSAKESLAALSTGYKTTLRYEVANPQTALESLGVADSKVWTLGSSADGTNWKTYGTNTAAITPTGDVPAGEMYLCYDAAAKKSWLLVGPQVDGVSGANLFVMNNAGTDKEQFPFDDKTTALYVGNVGAKYEVKLPTRKAGLELMMYGKGGIDNEDSPTQKIRYGIYPAIPGAYDDANGYHFTDVALSSLYDFAPFDAEFLFTMDPADQNAEVQGKWGKGFNWDAATGTLTVKNDHELYKYNFLNKKLAQIDEANDKPGVYFSWTFEAGADAAQQTASAGNERWFIKDPVRQPGENFFYFQYDKQPCAIGIILGVDGKGAGKYNTVNEYDAKVADASGDPNKTKLDQLEEGDVLDIAKALGQRAIWRKGMTWDVYGGPNFGPIDFTAPLPLDTPLALPALLKYDDTTGQVVITEYAKKYFCRRVATLKIHLQAADAEEHFEIVDAEKFLIRVKAGAAPVAHGNIQLRLEFTSDYAHQNMFFHVKN